MWIHLLVTELIYGANGSVVAPTITGGDDGWHDHRKHQGWNKKAWKRAQERENAITATIEATYQRMMGIAPNPVVVAEIRKAAPPSLAKPDYSQYFEFVAWLDGQIALAERFRAEAKAAEDAELDDEEALLLLIG